MGLIPWPPLLPPNSFFCFEVWFISNRSRYSLLTLTVSDLDISSQVQASSFMAAWAEVEGACSSGSTASIRMCR